MLTFEQEQFQGTNGIIEKLKVGPAASRTSMGQALLIARADATMMRLARTASLPSTRCDAIATQALPFQKVEHKISTLDAQPSSPSQASILVLVTGQLVVDDSPNPLSYSQSFQLIPEGETYYVCVYPGIGWSHRPALNPCYCSCLLRLLLLA